MFDKLRLFAARAMFALVLAMSLGFGLLIAGVAAILGLVMVAALWVAGLGANRRANTMTVDQEPMQRAEGDPAAQPA